MDYVDKLTKYMLYKAREIDHPVTEAFASFMIQTTINPSNKLLYFLKQMDIIFKKLRSSFLNPISTLRTKSIFFQKH